MMRILRLRHDKKRRLTVAPLFALLSICLSVVWLGNNAALCVASTYAYSSSIAISASAAAPACRCLKCGMVGGKCCCCTKTALGRNPVCLRALCDTEEAALARAAWLPPTLPIARLAVRPPSAWPVAPAPARRTARLIARSVAPLFQPPRTLSPVKKIVTS